MNRALLVGIDDYEAFSALSGCVNDVEALEPLLKRNADQTANFHCVARTSAKGPVKRDDLKREVKQLFGAGADVALLYFAGHGAGDEGEDVSLCTSDGTTETPGYELSDILTEIGRSEVAQKIVVLDCCFSGGAGGIPQLGTGDAAFLPPGLTILTASRGDQVSEETGLARGKFSTHLCEALEGGAADVTGLVTAANLYAYIDESFGAWEQRPVLRANVDQLQPLRQCEPTVTHAQLVDLADVFPIVDRDLPLDPSYEPDSEPKDAAHEAIFALLQACRDGKLVEPVGEDHMYYAAINSAACRLTPLGRHYCRQVHRGLR